MAKAKPAKRKKVATKPAAAKAKSSKVPAAKAKPSKATVAPKPKNAVAKSTPAALKSTATKSKPTTTSVSAAPTVDDSGLAWLDAGKGYALSLDAGKLVARNEKGKRLSAVPKELKAGDLADQLEALSDWLEEHDRECLATVEQWMLRSLPVPRAVLERVWADPSWQKPLQNAVVVEGNRAGLFRGVDAKKGIGIVDLDGETGWLNAKQVSIPHPILIDELDGWRELITQLGVGQGISQLHRETHVKPPGLTGNAIAKFEDGKFAMLMHAIGKARSLGYKSRGGFAVCKTYDDGAVAEARYWIGSDAPDAETMTGSLSWVDGRERSLELAAVGPVAFSEGMRMASSIYAARVVEKQETPS